MGSAGARCRNRKREVLTPCPAPHKSHNLSGSGGSSLGHLFVVNLYLMPSTLMLRF